MDYKQFVDAATKTFLDNPICSYLVLDTLTSAQITLPQSIMSVFWFLSEAFYRELLKTSFYFIRCYFMAVLCF